MIQFTRYLYIKDEVKLSILISLLKKNHQALFWAYEFYYSGFKTELWDFIWLIYYNFYATLNPRFKKFLQEKHDAWKNEENDKIISHVINNLHIRPWNADVFLLKQCTNIVVDDLYTLLTASNFSGIAHYIYQKDFTVDDAETVLKYFYKERNILTKTKANNWKKTSHELSKDELLADIIHFYTLGSTLKMGSNLYISDNEDITQYKIIYACYDKSFYPYKILPIVTQFGIDSESMLHLFHLSRDSCNDLKDIYYYNWLYYTLETPIWSNRIQEFEGIPNHEKKEIEFDDDDGEEEFYNHFNYEPDEQKLHVQHKNIGPISIKNDWKMIFELQSFKKGLFIPDIDFWEKNKKIHFV